MKENKTLVEEFFQNGSSAREKWYAWKVTKMYSVLFGMKEYAPKKLFISMVLPLFFYILTYNTKK